MAAVPKMLAEDEKILGNDLLPIEKELRRILNEGDRRAAETALAIQKIVRTFGDRLQRTQELRKTKGQEARKTYDRLKSENAFVQAADSDTGYLKTELAGWLNKAGEDLNILGYPDGGVINRLDVLARQLPPRHRVQRPLQDLIYNLDRQNKRNPQQYKQVQEAIRSL